MESSRQNVSFDITAFDKSILNSNMYHFYLHVQCRYQTQVLLVSVEHIRKHYVKQREVSRVRMAAFEDDPMWVIIMPTIE